MSVTFLERQGGHPSQQKTQKKTNGEIEKLSPLVERNTMNPTPETPTSKTGPIVGALIIVASLAAIIWGVSSCKGEKTPPPVTEATNSASATILQPMPGVERLESVRETVTMTPTGAVTNFFEKESLTGSMAEYQLHRLDRQKNSGPTEAWQRQRPSVPTVVTNTIVVLVTNTVTKTVTLPAPPPVVTVVTQVVTNTVTKTVPAPTPVSPKPAPAPAKAQPAPVPTPSGVHVTPAPGVHCVVRVGGQGNFHGPIETTYGGDGVANYRNSPHGNYRYHRHY